MAHRVFLADDHVVLREGLRALLVRQGLEVVGEAGDGQAAVDAIRQLHPDIAVIDIAMPGLNGIEAARAIARDCPNTRVVLLTALPEERYALAALRSGVRGFVLKTEASEDLVRAIHEVGRGGLYVSPGVSQVVLDAWRSVPEEAPDPLSDRERQVVRLVAEGRSSKQIAALLKISPKTVEFHRARAKRKLGVRDTAGLIRYVLQNGLGSGG